MDQSVRFDLLEASKSNYFKDGNKSIDFVLVVDRSIKDYDDRIDSIVNFLHFLHKQGVQLEVDHSLIVENIYVKIHLPKKALEHFARVYSINIDNSGHELLPTTKLHLRFTQSTLTRNNNDGFRRLKGAATSAEKIMIVNGLLTVAKFGENENMYGLAKLIRLNCIKSAYPLHDGTYRWDSRQEPNDRQLLYKYWSNFGVWYKEQPLNLIQKYFGSEVAFYFAWLGFYNKMLIPAALVGVICFLIGLIQLTTTKLHIIDEICESNVTMCPICHSQKDCIYKPLKKSCLYGKFNFLFDNNFTVFFAIVMSFWATLFLKLWKRKENILKIRWNVEVEEIDTNMRLEYIEITKHTKFSHTTKRMEPYTPRCLQILYYTATVGTCLLLIWLVIFAVFGVILVRITLSALIRTSSVNFLKEHSTFITMCSSCILQVIFIKIFGKWYTNLSEWLTILEHPRTQSEFDTSVIYKRYLLGFVNNYAGLFYIAFCKGRFYTPTHKRLLMSFETDICHPTGCVGSLCIQLAFLMLLKSFVGNILTLIWPKIKCCKRKRNHPENETIIQQWEEEFRLNPSGRYLLTSEFLEMIIQYGFVTFFAAAFPLGPLCALLSNAIELRLDALKLTTRQRRPIPKRVSGLGTWNGILRAVTILSTVTNAFVLAFTSDFVAREIYKYTKKSSLEGYIETTLAKFDMNDFESDDPLLEGSTICYYEADRYPPDHPHKYELTSEFWYELALRLVLVIIFEHFIMLFNGILSYVISELPATVKETLLHKNKLQRDKRKEVVVKKIAENPSHKPSVQLRTVTRKK